jgi:hypothetical protein
MTRLDPWDRALLAALDGAPEEHLTLAELADRYGLSPVLLEALAREGLLIPAVTDPDPRFPSSEGEVVRAGLALVEAGLPLGELLDLARRMDDAMRPLAARAVEVFADFVRDSVEATAADADDAARRLVEAFRRMLPAAGALVDHHFRRLIVAGARARLAEGEP